MPNPQRNISSSQSSSDSQSLNLSSYSSLLIHFFKKPHALPFLLSIFLILTWLSLCLQHSYSIQSSHHITPNLHKDDDTMANLVRFASGFPSPSAKDNRGGAVSCTLIHLGQIRPGALRGNHRHNTCNETFVIWGHKQDNSTLENAEENINVSRITKDIERATGSLQKFPRKTSLRKGSPSFSVLEPKRNNIVSNISSSFHLCNRTKQLQP